MSSTSKVCPLCGAAGAEGIHTSARGEFLRCDGCALAFLDPRRWPARDDELARYGLHRHDSDDVDYLRHLGRLAGPVAQRTPRGARGLDYGSGPGDALAQVLTQSGRPTVAFDPVFRNEASLLAARYDFVVCCEVLEHVHRPMDVLEQFAALVRPGGLIGVMTGLYDAAPSFADWWYLRDSTHVCFYGVDTMRWIADRFGWEVEVRMPSVALFAV